MKQREEEDDDEGPSFSHSAAYMGPDFLSNRSLTDDH